MARAPSSGTTRNEIFPSNSPAPSMIHTLRRAGDLCMRRCARCIGLHPDALMAQELGQAGDGIRSCNSCLPIVHEGARASLGRCSLEAISRRVIAALTLWRLRIGPPSRSTGLFARYSNQHHQVVAGRRINVTTYDYEYPRTVICNDIGQLLLERKLAPRSRKFTEGSLPFLRSTNKKFERQVGSSETTASGSLIVIAEDYHSDTAHDSPGLYPAPGGFCAVRIRLRYVSFPSPPPCHAPRACLAHPAPPFPAPRAPSSPPASAGAPHRRPLHTPPSSHRSRRPPSVASPSAHSHGAAQLEAVTSFKTHDLPSSPPNRPPPATRAHAPPYITYHILSGSDVW
ncbi:hypothetical protein KC361_g20 [Hortaea werneckii]|nr:hypothetical protein KC361_g20 [Hortaea werneckii]